MNRIPSRVTILLGPDLTEFKLPYQYLICQYFTDMLPQISKLQGPTNKTYNASTL